MTTQELDIVLGGCWQQFGRTGRFNSGELAKIASIVYGREVKTAEMSQSLQRYRQTRRRRFDVACEGYGAQAQWRISGVHNHMSTRRRQQTLKHKDYVRQGRALSRG